MADLPLAAREREAVTASLYRLRTGPGAGAYYTQDSRREARPDRRDEYYAGQNNGVWWSPGGDVVAHGADIDKDSFRELCAGLNPLDGKPLVRGAGPSHWAGTDMTLTPGKSVSVLWAAGDQEQRNSIEQAHAKAVARALQFVQDEGLVEVRYGAQGANSVRPSYLIVGRFDHFTSRAGDPNIHTHCVIINVAGAPPEAQTGRYRFRHLTIDTDRLFTAQLAVGAAYRAELSRQLASLGLETRPAGKGQWELKGIDPEVLEAFSKRSKEMEKVTRRDASAAELEVAALQTRGGKDELPTGKALEGRWHTELAALKAEPWRDALDPERRAEPTPEVEPDREREMFFEPPEVAGDAPTHVAANKLFKHETVVGRYDLLHAGFVEAALRGQGPDVVYEQIAAMEAQGTLLRLSPEIWTTPALAACEAALLRAAERPLEREWISAKVLDQTLAGAKHLSDEQAEAVREAARDDGVSIVEAGAGTGKTTTAKVIVEAARRSGLKVIALAPSWVAADELTKSTGLKAQAIAKWRYDRATTKDRALEEKTVLLVDEAGMVGTRELSAILVAAHEAGSKVVLLGDRRQLAPVPGGSALRAVSEALRRNAVLHDVRRQQVEWQRAASVAMARGDAEAGLRTYARHERVLLADSAEAALDRTIEIWRTLQARHGEGVVIATRRNRDATALNARARETLRAEGRLGGPEVEAPALDREGKPVPLTLSAGDHVRFGENLAHHGVRNGTRAKVAAVACGDDGGIRAAFDLEDGRRVEGDWTSFAAPSRDGKKLQPPRIVHGYAGTVYAAQGRTVPAAVLHIASSTDAREVYVGLTRHTEDAYVVVDKARLDALCRRRQPDPRLEPPTSDLQERLFHEASQYGEKRNVVDYVEDRQAFVRTGEIRTATDGLSNSLAMRTIQAARAIQRALAWLREAPLPAPAWLYLERMRDRLRDLPRELREIVQRAPSFTRSPSRDRSGPDLGR